MFGERPPIPYGIAAYPGLFSGLVVIARAKHPIPSRTRPLSAVAPMVLRLKTWESRSPPNLKRDISPKNDIKIPPRSHTKPSGTDAGWSSPVARQAHNLKVTGSNPVPATNLSELPGCQESGSFCFPSTSARMAPISQTTSMSKPSGRGVTKTDSIIDWMVIPPASKGLRK